MNYPTIKCFNIFEIKSIIFCVCHIVLDLFKYETEQIDKSCRVTVTKNIFSQLLYFLTFS